MHLAMKMFFDVDGSFALGPGRIELLRLTHTLGSLRKAALATGMSYRRAWGCINKAEGALGLPLLERTSDSIPGRPLVLTPHALELVHWFEREQEKVRQALQKLEAGMPGYLARRSSSDPHFPDTARAAGRTVFSCNDEEEAGPKPSATLRTQNSACVSRTASSYRYPTRLAKRKG